jgi:hypothetical protein
MKRGKVFVLNVLARTMFSLELPNKMYPIFRLKPKAKLEFFPTEGQFKLVRLLAKFTRKN